MSIAAVERAILTAVNDALPGVLKETGSLPGNWSIDTLKRALQFAPGVYVSFLGGQADDYKTARINAKFEVYLVTKGAIEKFRRDQPNSGAYAILQNLIPVLHKMQIADVGILKFERVNNLFKESLFDMGGTVYGLTFAIELYFDPDAAVDPRSIQLDFTANNETVTVL